VNDFSVEMFVSIGQYSKNGTYKICKCVSGLCV